MDQMWERIKRGLKDGAALSMEKIEEYTKIGKFKLEEFAAKRKIERNLVDMGERAFEMIADGNGSKIAGDTVVTRAVENVKALRDELIELDKKIKAAAKEEKPEAPDRARDEEVTGI